MTSISPLGKIVQFSFQSSGIDYKFHKYCSGLAKCKEAAQAVRAISNCENTASHAFMPYTNYMFMEYACIEGMYIMSAPEQFSVLYYF